MVIPNPSIWILRSFRPFNPPIGPKPIRESLCVRDISIRLYKTLKYLPGIINYPVELSPRVRRRKERRLMCNGRPISGNTGRAGSNGHGFYGRSNYSIGLPDRERARPANEDRQRVPGCIGFEYLTRRIGDHCWLVATTLGESVTLEDAKEFALYKAQASEASRLPSHRLRRI